MAQAGSAWRSRFLLVGLILAHLTAISHQVDGGTGVSLQTPVSDLVDSLSKVEADTKAAKG